MRTQWRRSGTKVWYPLEELSVAMNGTFDFREKPPFEPGFFWNGSTAVEWVDSEEWFGDYNRGWVRVKIERVESPKV